MITKRALWALAALVPAAASAQQNTQCRTDQWGVTNCQTTGQPNGGGINWGLARPKPDIGAAFNRGYEDGQRRRALAEQQAFIAQQRQALANQQAMDANTQSQAAQSEAEQKAVGRRAGELVAAGDCPGAVSVALGAGNFDLAQTVRDYCSKK